MEDDCEVIKGINLRPDWKSSKLNFYSLQIKFLTHKKKCSKNVYIFRF